MERLSSVGVGGSGRTKTPSSLKILKVELSLMELWVVLLTVETSLRMVRDGVSSSSSFASSINGGVACCGGVGGKWSWLSWGLGSREELESSMVMRRFMNLVSSG